MKVTELTRYQLSELKQAYICEHVETPSYGLLADADELVTDEGVAEYFSGVNFRK